MRLTFFATIFRVESGTHLYSRLEFGNASRGPNLVVILMHKLTPFSPVKTREVESQWGQSYTMENPFLLFTRSFRLGPKGGGQPRWGSLSWWNRLPSGRWSIRHSARVLCFFFGISTPPFAGADIAVLFAEREDMVMPCISKRVCVRVRARENWVHVSMGNFPPSFLRNSNRIFRNRASCVSGEGISSKFWSRFALFVFRSCGLQRWIGTIYCFW